MRHVSINVRGKSVGVPHAPAVYIKKLQEENEK